MSLPNGHSPSEWSRHAAPAAAPFEGAASPPDSHDHAGEITPSNATLQSIEDFVRDNPMTVLVGTAVAGAVLAMALSRRSPRADDRRWLRDLSRHTDDIQRNVTREVRSLLNEDRINRIVNSIPTAEVSKAVSPWLAQVIEAMSAAKTQAQKSVADTAQKVHDKLA